MAEIPLLDAKRKELQKMLYEVQILSEMQDGGPG